MSSPSGSPKGKGKGKGKGPRRPLTAAERHRQAGGGFLNEVTLTCSSEDKAQQLVEAFEADSKRVETETVYATGKKVVVEFKSTRKAIESLDQVLDLNLPKVQARNAKPPHGYKLVKKPHLIKFVKEDVPKASGVVSAVLDTHDAGQPAAAAARGRKQAAPKVTWVLRCEGIAPQTWTAASKIIPSILFDKVLGRSDEARAIRSSLKAIVKAHLGEKTRGNKEYTEKNVKAYYAAKNHDNIRLVLTRLLRSGVCQLFEDPKGGNLRNEEVRGKGKGKGQGHRSTSVGAHSRRRLRRKPTRVTSHEPSHERPAAKGKGHPEGKGHGKGLPKGKGKGLAAAKARARTNIYNHYLKPSVRAQADEMEADDLRKFLDKLVELEREVRLLGNADAREELKKYLTEVPEPVLSRSDKGDDSKDRRKQRVEDAFALGFALCEAGVSADALSKKTLRRPLKGNKKLRKALGVARIKKQIRHYSQYLPQ